MSGKHTSACDVVGLYPITEDECCYFLAADFDGDHWQEDITALRSACADLSIPIAIERSRSGNGGHAWFFFEDKVPASIARKLGTMLLTCAMSKRHEIKFKSYDRLFPNQDTMPKGGFGNLIALPLQGQARRKGNSVFVGDNFEVYSDQWAFLSGVKRLSCDEVLSLIDRLGENSELGDLAQSMEDGASAKPWESAKPLVELTSADFNAITNITKANMLHLKKVGISQRALDRIKRLGAFKNPDFYKAQAMRLPTHGKARIIDTTEEDKEYLSIPRGCEQELLALLDAAHAQYRVDDNRNQGIPVQATFNGTLRLDQATAAQALLSHETGVLAATTAFGKTVVGSFIISERKVNALVLVHTSTLLDQWRKSLDRFLVLKDATPESSAVGNREKRRKVSAIGVLGAAKNNLTGRVDVAIMQSLVQGDVVKDIVKGYGLVIVDECHHVSAVSFEKVLKKVNARYVYGLTATPTRQDGQHPIVFMQCGGIRYRVDVKLQAVQSGIGRFVIPRFTSFRKPVGASDGEFTIVQIYSSLAQSVTRNKLIVSDVSDALKRGRTPIVLTQRAAHVVNLSEKIAAFCPNVIQLTGQASVKARREEMERLHSIPTGTPFVVVATGKYVGEGFDEPRLDTLFLVAPISWHGTLQQYAGRLHREYPGKQSVMVYDYVDIHIKMLESMYHKRVTGYNSMGYKAMSESTTVENAGLIYDERSFAPVFENDLLSARNDIVIVSPYLRKKRVGYMMSQFASARVNGARVIVVTRPSDAYKLHEQAVITAMVQELSAAGMRIVVRPNIHQKFAVIDRRVVWYGSINLLSYGGAEESIMRFENMEIADELLATLSKDEPSQ